MLLVTAVEISAQFPRSDKSRHNGKLDAEPPSDSSFGNGSGNGTNGNRRGSGISQDSRNPEEAPTGFDNPSNGFDE